MFVLLAWILEFGWYWVPGSLWWIHKLAHILKEKLSNSSFPTHIIVTLVTTEKSQRGRATRDCWGKLIAAMIKVWGVKEKSRRSAFCVFPGIIWSTSVLLVLDNFHHSHLCLSGASYLPHHILPIGWGCPNHTRPRTYTLKKSSSALIPQNTKEKSQAKERCL